MAADQKIENLLNLALDATEEEREKSLELNVGYDTQEKKWDLIIKYAGNLDALRNLNVEVTELQGGYAILKASESEISQLASVKEIEYIEKPKRLFFAVDQGKTASCIDELQIDPPLLDGEEALFGKGILIAVIDSGVDYTQPEFRNSDGSSRILAIWDQSVPGNPPEGYLLGTEYVKTQIDEALRSGNTLDSLETLDISGHGTEVLGIAAGNNGVAPQADILVVKLGNSGEDSFPMTTELMQAVDYVVKKAMEWNLPTAINLSFGNVYGPHNGSGLLETYLTDMAGIWKNVIVTGTGNEGNTAGHVSRMVDSRSAGAGNGGAENGGAGNAGTGNERETTEIEMAIAPGEVTVNVQLWKSYADEFDVFLIPPNGQILGPLPKNLGIQRFLTEGTELLIYYGEPSPFSISQEIYFDFLPRETYIDSGIWRFRLVPTDIKDGKVDLWLPSASTLNEGTRFYRPDVDQTLTIPSTARKVIAVGAYDSRSLIYAPFSGRGAAQTDNIKPDLAAPGVNIRTAAVGGGYTNVTGTSFSVPFVTGAAALLMEWGIVRENDPYLYGEKVRAYLIRGARRLPGYEVWPNNQLGYGYLCVKQSIPEK